MYVPFFIPLIVFSFFLLIRSVNKITEKSKIPFTDNCLRPPGTYLKDVLDRLNSKIDDRLFLSFVITLIIIFIPLIPAFNNFQIIFGTLFFSVVIYQFFKLRKEVEKRKSYYLGFLGEQAVAGKLNQLMLDGYHVFHDLPFDKFNIDHVVIGENGVFCIETKTRRKPKINSDKAEYKVYYNGNTLKWPNFEEKKSLEQSQRNARKLSDFLSQATGEKVTAKPILAIPGWLVKRQVEGPVLNDKELENYIKQQQNTPIAPEQIKRIIHQIRQKCEIKIEKQ